MVNKKKYRFGFVILLGLLFMLLFSTYLECYANVSEEYITYLMESIRDEGTFLNNSETNKTYVTNFLNNTDNITTLTNQLNTRLASHNWSNLSDYNLFATFQTSSSNIKIKFCFSNCTFPNNVSGVGYTQFRGNYFGPYNSQNNLIVYLTLNNLASYSEYFTTGTNEYYDYIDRHVNANYTTVYFENVYNRIPTQSVYIINAYNQLTGALLNDTRGTYQNNLPIEPEEPSGDSTTGGTGTITNNSGDTTGKIDLSGIEQGIGNIQNQISGDTQKVIENQNQNTETIVNALSGETEKITNTLTDSADDLIDNTIITSGDIESALNFEIAQDPYSNFWFTLTNNLKSALFGIKRSIDISFQGRTWTISLDEYMVLPAWLVIILTPFSTAFFTWVLVRQFKLIFDKLASGNLDSLLKENSEERYFQFVLGGVQYVRSFIWLYFKNFLLAYRFNWLYCYLSRTGDFG